MSKIVVVDDSYAELQVIEGVLKGANHTVVSYPNTDKLEDKVVGEKPDLIVLDVVMPGRNGFQACRDLKNDDRARTSPSSSVPPKATKATSSGAATGRQRAYRQAI